MPEDVKRSLIVTDTYRMLFASDPGSAEHVLRAVTLELDRIVRVLTSLLESVQHQVDYWQNCGFLVLSDTNFYLSPTSADYLEMADLAHALDVTADHITLVVPIAVIDELDNLKRDKQRGDQARWALRSIEKHSGSLGARGILQHRGALNQPDPGPLVDIAVVFDTPGHSPAIVTDDEIVTRGQDVQTMAGKPVHLASYDLGFQLRARSLGLSITTPTPP